MEWTAGTEHARVVNMSPAFPNTAGRDPLETAVDEMTSKYGTLFVVAAGNDGNDPANGDDYLIGSPADAAAALSVGAVDRDDQLAPFSSRGPSLDGDAVKPEITGPGFDITHALSGDAVVRETAEADLRRRRLPPRLADPGARADRLHRRGRRPGPFRSRPARCAGRSATASSSWTRGPTSPVTR